MIKQLAILSGLTLLLGCGAPENEQRQRIPDNTYRPSGFHAFINHGTGNEPISLIKVDSLYHLFYTTGTDEWGHLTSLNMLSWTPQLSFPISRHGFGEVIWETSNLTGLDAPWNILVSDGTNINLRYSTDGVNWENYNQNPVLKARGRPSVTWSDDLELWILTISNGKEIAIFTSDNLSEWQKASSYSTNTDLSKASLIKMEDRWLMLMHGESLSYQTGTFDGVNFQPQGELINLDGMQCSSAAYLNSTKETVFIARNKESNAQLPTFSIPITLSYKNEKLNLFPTSTFKSEIVGKRRAKLSKLFTDGPSWYNLVLDQEFEELEIVVSDKASDIRILWNKSDKKIILTGSAMPQNKSEGQTIDANFSAQNLEVDLLIDHASVDLFFNQGEYATSILTSPATFLTSVEVYLDGAKYDARGVLYDIGI